MANKAGSLVLAAGMAHADLVGVAANECAGTATPIDLVTAGSPTTSYLYDKITGTNLCSGVRMPASGPPYLSDADIQIITNWICEGAPNN